MTGMSETMTTMRMTILVLMTAAVLAGCGRKNFPVPPTPEGQEPRPLQIDPGSNGLASAPGIVKRDSSGAVPGEVSRNPNADQRPFLLDGLLN